MKNLIIITLLFTITQAAFIKPAHAANIGLSIYPPLVKINIKPGKTITQVFKIENLSENSKFLYARIIPFTESDNQGNPIIDPKNTAKWLEYFSLANSKIELGKPFELEAGKSDQIILSINIPKTAPLKDLYATLLISTYQTEINPNFQGTYVNASIGSNLLLTISSQANPSTILRITDITPEFGKYLKIGDIYIIDSITPISFTANAKNDGDFLAETKGIFKIERNENTPIHIVPVLPQYVIAKSDRVVSTLNSQSFLFEPSAEMIGKYTARIDIKSENANTSSSITLIILPIKILIGIAASIIFLTVILKITRKNTVD